jgi:hypothetical protein
VVKLPYSEIELHGIESSSAADKMLIKYIENTLALCIIEWKYQQCRALAGSFYSAQKEFNILHGIIGNIPRRGERERASGPASNVKRMNVCYTRSSSSLRSIFSFSQPASQSREQMPTFHHICMTKAEISLDPTCDSSPGRQIKTFDI